MKKATTISLALLLLLLSARDLVTFAAFKLQQETIAAKLCVNKYEPIPMCLGSCFLDLQLTQDVEENGDPFATLSLNLNDKPAYFQSTFELIPDHPEITHPTVRFSYQSLQSQAVFRKILQPPRQQFHSSYC